MCHEQFSTDLSVLLNHVLRSWSHEEIEVEDPSNSAESQRWVWRQSNIYKGKKGPQHKPVLHYTWE